MRDGERRRAHVRSSVSLYYLACADHLALGYVDHPPLSIFVLAATRAVFGDSLIAIRSVVAIVGALNVLVVAALTAELGGRRYAQALAMLAVLAAPLYLLGQLEAVGYIGAPIWILGLVSLLRGRHRAPGRVLGLAYLTVLVLLILAGTSRVGYLAPAYGWLFPAGAVAIEGWVHRVSLRGLMLGSVGLAGVVMAPFAVPILPVERYLAYADALGQAPATAERKELAALPQHYADMHGWEALVADIADGWQAIPPHERASAVIFTNNYGEAGAVDLFGPAHGLPPAISGHNNYHLWGTRGREGSTMLIIGAHGLTRDVLERAFEDVEQVGRIDCGYCMPYEDGSPLWVLRGRRSGETLAERWPGLAHFD